MCSLYVDSLKPLDIEFMKRLHDKVNIIPLIAKADTLTPDECREFKKTVSTWYGHQCSCTLLFYKRPPASYGSYLLHRLLTTYFSTHTNTGPGHTAVLRRPDGIRVCRVQFSWTRVTCCWRILEIIQSQSGIHSKDDKVKNWAAWQKCVYQAMLTRIPL